MLVEMMAMLAEEKTARMHWHHVLKGHCVHLCPCVSACETYAVLRAPGSASVTHQCFLELPNSFLPGDGLVLRAYGEAARKDQASAIACHTAMAMLLCDQPGSVVLRRKHWRIPIGELLGKANSIALSQEIQACIPSGSLPIDPVVLERGAAGVRQGEAAGSPVPPPRLPRRPDLALPLTHWSPWAGDLGRRGGSASTDAASLQHRGWPFWSPHDLVRCSSTTTGHAPASGRPHQHQACNPSTQAVASHALGSEDSASLCQHPAPTFI